MTRPTIEIYQASTRWYARFPADSETARIMGTRNIETAFTMGTPLWEVIERIAELNPGFEVYPNLTIFTAK